MKLPPYAVYDGAIYRLDDAAERRLSIYTGAGHWKPCDDWIDSLHATPVEPAEILPHLADWDSLAR